MNMKKIVTSFQHRQPSVLGIDHMRKFAILVPLIEENNELHVLFEVRSHTLRRQPNEICFPGGGIEENDANEAEAAIRETAEELGIPFSSITEVFPLDYLVSGIVIYPFVGKISAPEQISINTEEVAEVFTVPLAYLLETPVTIHKVPLQPTPAEDFPYHSIPGGKDYTWQPQQIEEHFYHYKDKVIWGLTARILHHFLEVIKTSS